MLKIAICNETEAYGKVLERSIEEWAVCRNFNVQIKKFFTEEEVLADIEQSGYFHIVLIDTGLKGKMNGIVTAQKVRQIYEYFCLILLSGQNQMFREVFRLQPFRYLEKPVVKGKLFESLDQAVDKYRFQQEIFVFRFKGMTYCIRLCEVLYFASDRRVVRICMEDGSEYVFYKKLDELERELQHYTAKFFRLHQSYLVNGEQVEQYHPRYVIMRNRELIPISTDRRSCLKKYKI